MQLSYTFELPMGHRLQYHDGRCRMPHGHNYLITVTISAEHLHRSGSASGMLLDFSVVKQVCRDYFDSYDHSFVVEYNDPLKDALQSFGNIVQLWQPPTVEVLTQLWHAGLQPLFKGFKLHLRVNETRDCFTAFGDIE